MGMEKLTIEDRKRLVMAAIERIEDAQDRWMASFPHLDRSIPWSRLHSAVAEFAWQWRNVKEILTNKGDP